MKPGTILHSRRIPLTPGTPVASEDASAVYQVLYRTTDEHGSPSATVATVFVPQRHTAGPGRLVSYQIAEDSVTTACATRRPTDPDRPGPDQDDARSGLGRRHLGLRGSAVGIRRAQPRGTHDARRDHGRRTASRRRHARKVHRSRAPRLLRRLDSEHVGGPATRRATPQPSGSSA